MADTNDRAIAMLLDLPFAPGLSPFRIKGVAYRGHLEYVERFVPGGNAAVLAALNRPELDAFFAQPFLASTRYDVFPLAIAGIGCARVTGQPFRQFVRERSKWQANEDVNGVYRWMLRITSPETVAARLPRLISQYFDFGEQRIDVMEKGHLRAARTGMPLPLAAWYVAVSEAYMEVVIGLAGGRDVRCESAEPEIEGRSHGVDIVSLPMEVRWG